MKNGFVPLLIILSLNSIVFSQTLMFQKTLYIPNSHEGEYSKIINFQNGYLITFLTNDVLGLTDACLIKTDYAGNIIWERVIGGVENEWFSDIKITANNNIILAGHTRSFGPNAPIADNIFIVKLDSIGNGIVAKAYGGNEYDGAISIQQTLDGGFIITGYTRSYGFGDYDIYLIKINNIGDMVWTKVYGTPNIEKGYSVIQTANNNYVIAGYCNDLIGNNDFFLMKTDSVGNILWVNSYGGNNHDYYNIFLNITDDNGYIISGNTNSFGAGDIDMYVIKTDINGNLQWSKTYGGNDEDRIWSIEPTSDDGYILCGETSSFGAGNVDTYVIKIDSNGDILWTKTYGGYNNEHCGHAIQSDNGGYIITSASFGFSSGISDLYLIKTDSMGNSGCNEYNTNTIINEPNTIVTSLIFQTTSGGIAENVYPDVAIKLFTTYTLCMTNSIEEIKEPFLQYIIYPNPTTGKISVQSENVERIEILDFTGKYLTGFENLLGIKEIDLSHQAKGIYFIKVTTNKGVAVGKVVLE